MIFLAEIADKMPTTLQMWSAMIIYSVIMSVLGIIHQKIALIMFVIGGIISLFLLYASYHEAFLESFFSQSVQDEMGAAWIVNSLASSLCPLLFTGTTFLWQLKKKSNLVPETDANGMQ